MKKILSLCSVVFVLIMWISCSNNSSSDKPSWTPPALPIHEGIGIVEEKVDGLGCEFLIVKVGNEDFTVKITEEFAAQMNNTKTGEYVSFKASDNETFEFERLDDSGKNLQAAVYFRVVNN